MTKEEIERRMAEAELRLKERELNRPGWRQPLIAVLTVALSILGSGITTYTVGKSQERTASAAIVNDVFESDDVATSFRKLHVMLAAGLLPNSARLAIALDTLRPLVARNYFYRGRQLDSEAKLYEAVSAYQSAVELQDDAESHFYLGSTLLKLGYQEKSSRLQSAALQHLLKAEEMNPDDRLTTYWVGRAYLDNLHADEALARFKLVVKEADPKYEFYNKSK